MSTTEATLPRQKAGLDGTTLKLIMMGLMLLDHIEYFWPPHVWPVLHVISRCVAPLFAYMAVEGLLHTSNRYRYMGRLLLWSAIMFAGNLLLNNVIIKDPTYHISNNIFLTLFAGVLMLHLLSMVRKGNAGPVNAGLVLGVVAVFAAGVLFTEGGTSVIPFMLITYCFRKRPAVRNLLYAALAALLFAISFVPYGTIPETMYILAFNSDFMLVLVIPFLYLYNGKRGSNSPVMKYLFYVFYPLHIWAITLAAWALHA